MKPTGGWQWADPNAGVTLETAHSLLVNHCSLAPPSLIFSIPMSLRVRFTCCWLLWGLWAHVQHSAQRQRTCPRIQEIRQSLQESYSEMIHSSRDPAYCRAWNCKPRPFAATSIWTQIMQDQHRGRKGLWSKVTMRPSRVHELQIQFCTSDLKRSIWKTA